MSGYVFGDTSERNLVGVRAELEAVTRLALQRSLFDFGITRGVGTIEQQADLVQQGRSQTMKSLHLVGHAIDFSPYWSGKFRPDAWPFYYGIADAFRSASQELATPIRWGGAWGVDLWRFRNSQAAQEVYIKSKEDGRVFFDGPHIELCRATYVPDFSAIRELYERIPA